jgi:hypothetical protein
LRPSLEPKFDALSKKFARASVHYRGLVQHGSGTRAGRAGRVAIFPALELNIPAIA